MWCRRPFETASGRFLEPSNALCDDEDGSWPPSPQRAAGATGRVGNRGSVVRTLKTSTMRSWRVMCSSFRAPSKPWSATTCSSPPTTAEGSAEPGGRSSAGTPGRGPLTVGACRLCTTGTCRSSSRRAGPAAWPRHLVGRRRSRQGNPVSWLVDGVREGIAHGARGQAAQRSWCTTIAMPVVGVGRGGFDGRRGDVIGHLLATQDDFVH